MKQYQLRVISAVCTNFAVVWFAVAFGAHNFDALMQGSFYGIVNIYFALEAEKKLEKYEY